MLWRLRVETEDDLWTLARLARKGMDIGMLGERRDQTTGGEEGGRAKAAERKKMWIRLSIESTDYQSFSEISFSNEENLIYYGIHPNYYYY